MRPSITGNISEYFIKASKQLEPIKGNFGHYILKIVPISNNIADIRLGPLLQYRVSTLPI